MPIKNQGKLDELETIFKGKMEKDPNNPAFLEMVAEIYRNARNYEKAAETYQALCKAQPSNLKSFYYAAGALQKSNQPELAEKMLSQAEGRTLNQSARTIRSLFTHVARLYLCRR